MTETASGNIRSILATDCGSTTTKAILIEKRDGEFRLIARGEAPTTVESPVEDVTVGVLNAIAEIQGLTGRQLLTDDGKAILKRPSGWGAQGDEPLMENRGVDLFVSTSSAGGGLQMLVAGVVKNISCESAMRAALGAGGIVMDVIAANDGRLPHQKIERIRQLRPDMILLSGGTDGGTTSHIAEIAELIALANPHARLGTTCRLPLLFAGNADARNLIRERLGEITALDFADNLRPSPDTENPDPARRKIQEFFLDHVMRHAPGYATLLNMTDHPIVPTPGAVGDIMQLIASETKSNILGVDIGGATTDVFSVFNGLYNKTVSANLGMSYSLANVVSEAGLEKITRWLPFSIDERSLLNGIMNKMIRPTTIPATLEDLIVEHACAREALRLSLVQHREMTVELKGIQRDRTVGDIFDQSESGASFLSMKDLGLLIGSGGVLSHAPRRQQAAMMLIDAFLPEGITNLAVDSIFMMPQLGVLSRVNKRAAVSVFERDCLIRLGTCIAPTGNIPLGEKAITVEFISGFPMEKIEVEFGKIVLFEIPAQTKIKCKVRPSKNLDLGLGMGKERVAEIEGGEVGLIIDTRGRPLNIPPGKEERIPLINSWFDSMNLYP